MRLRKEILQAVSQLEIRTRHSVTALLAGDYRSAFRGSGMHFREFRHYEPGDDIRHMSWPVTARTGRATVKIYDEERELCVVLAVDVSGSSALGSEKTNKRQMYAELTALIGMASMRAGDKFGLLLFDKEPLFFLPPRRTRGQVSHALTQVLSAELMGKRSDIRPAFNFLNRTLNHRAIILVLSDFQTPSFEPELRLLSKRNEVILLHCVDDLERGLSLQGVYEGFDPETGECYLLDGNSTQVRKLLAEEQIHRGSGLEDLCRTSGADYFSLSVQDDYLQRLVHYFRRRGPARL